MVVLGLGSNVGDRLEHLRRAYHEIAKLDVVTIKQISPVYISDALLPENAPDDWDMPYLNACIRCDVTCSPEMLLPMLKKIELTIGRTVLKRHWGPRMIDIDILAWDDVVIQSDTLTVPHKNLIERPFALWPLADVAPFWQFPDTKQTAEQCGEKLGSRFSGDAPFSTRQIQQRIDTPALVGILNITPDSFSDGGDWKMVAAKNMAQAGATVIDIGAESTAPNAKPVTPNEEWQRLQPVLSAIMADKHTWAIPQKISVDTRHVEVAEKALALGVDWINDVTGFQDANMRALLAGCDAKLVMMHHLSIPPSRDLVLPVHKNGVQHLLDWGKSQIALLEESGISRDRIIFDPGIGFGKTKAQSLAIIQNLSCFHALGVKTLIGHSRKSFLTNFTDLPAKDRDIETLALSLYLADQPLDYLRIHNVSDTARAIKTSKSVKY